MLKPSTECQEPIRLRKSEERSEKFKSQKIILWGSETL